MARDYGKVSARFWTGDTGRQLRRLGAEVQLLALYLVTSPSSNMVGLYYLPIPVMVHETGLTFEGASKALRSLGEVGFAHYDEDQEVIWVPEMARHQVDVELKPNDKRIKGVMAQVAEYRKCRYYGDFIEKYRAPFLLSVVAGEEAPSKPTRRAKQAPSKGHRSQEQDQEQDQEQKLAAARVRGETKPAPEPEAATTGPATTEAIQGPWPELAGLGEVSAEAPPCAPGEPQGAREGNATEGSAAAGQHGAAVEEVRSEVQETAAAQAPRAPMRAPAAPIDDFPVRPLNFQDLTELGPLAAELRSALERRAEWKFLVAAHDRKAEIRQRLEAAVVALGVERSEELCWRIMERRKRQGIQPPKAMAFFADPLEEELKGGDPMPTGAAEQAAEQQQRILDAESAARWEPLLARMDPATREAYEADKARMAEAIRAKGYWRSEEWKQFNEAEEVLFLRWSRRVALAAEGAA